MSKEAADIILANDDFQTLSYAIAEGKGKSSMTLVYGDLRSMTDRIDSGNPFCQP